MDASTKLALMKALAVLPLLVFLPLVLLTLLEPLRAWTERRHDRQERRRR
jgi:hypothetical protein